MNFEEIYKKYFSDVFRYILRLSGDENTAEEITAETFFKALDSIDSFRGDCDVRVWLCQIAKNKYFTNLKKSRRLESLDDEDLPQIPDSKASPEETVLRRDEAFRIQKLLHEIPEPYREVFMWRVFAELSFRQIGQIFGKSENWACVTYHRARMKIKEKMEGIDNEK